MKASIVIPCYNEEKNIRRLTERFQVVAKKMGEIELELVLVDNGSHDNTQREIQACAECFDFIKLAKVEVNQGYGFGILTGLTAATGDWLGWMHADLQSDPDVFIKMFECATKEEGNFLYKGSRKNRPFLDTLFTIGMSIFETLYLGVGLWDINAQPTLLDRGYYESWREPPHDFSLDLFVYYFAKKRHVIVKRFESIQYEREAGVSSWNTGMSARFKLIKRVLSYSKQMKNRYK